MPTVHDNREFWGNRYQWIEHGDEWSDQADHCKVPYPTWKADVVDAFLNPYVRAGAVVVEIAPGHGRWTEQILRLVQQGRCIAFDVSPSCIEYCDKKLASSQLELHVNDGRSLPEVGDGSVDFVFSFDSFVHIEPDDTDAYLGEFARVLKPGGRACIHHPGAPTPEQRKKGGRSRTTGEAFNGMLVRRGFRLLSQLDAWGENDRSTTRLFGDLVSVFQKP